MYCCQVNHLTGNAFTLDSSNFNIMIVQNYNLNLFADYFQFYIQDEQVPGDLSNSWTPDAVKRLLALADGTVGIGTVRNMFVPVTIKFFDSEPSLADLDNYNQVNECDIIITSGKMVVAGCTDYFPEAVRIETSPGTYRVRIYYSNLEKLSEDGLDGDDNYELHLWRVEQSHELKVIKQFKEACA